MTQTNLLDALAERNDISQRELARRLGWEQGRLYRLAKSKDPLAALKHAKHIRQCLGLTKVEFAQIIARYL